MENAIVVSQAWDWWLSANWSDLVGGAKIVAPQHLPHPQFSGFLKEQIATPGGQSADWVLSVTVDGSRVHVHEFANGRLVVHRDRYDPNRSLGHLIAHLVAETPLVPVLAVVGIFALAVRSSRA